jgi:hypothetical protein
MSDKGIYADILVNARYTFPSLFKNYDIIRTMNNLMRSSPSVLGDARHNYRQLQDDRKSPALKGDVCEKPVSDEIVANEIYRYATALHVHGGTSSDGISANYSRVFIPMDDPSCQIHENKNDLPEVRYTHTTRDYYIFEPTEEYDKKKYNAWTPGGAYIQSPEGMYNDRNRWARKCFQDLVTNVHYPDGRELVPLHDRKETWEEYEMMVR